MSTAVDVQCKHQSGEDRVRINVNLYATNTNRAPFQSGASAPSRDILGCDFDGMITVFKNMVTIVENCLNGLPFFSAKAIASSLVLNASTMLDKGSALDWGKKSLQTLDLFFGSSKILIIMMSTHVEAQPISGFSQRSLVSKSIFHFWVFLMPDCMEVRAGTKIRTLRVLICSSGTPVKVVMSWQNEGDKRRTGKLWGTFFHQNSSVNVWFTKNKIHIRAH